MCPPLCVRPRRMFDEFVAGQALVPVRGCDLSLRGSALLFVIPAINTDRGGRDCPESICFAFVFYFLIDS